jgi:hypothetical protein
LREFGGNREYFAIFADFQGFPGPCSLRRSDFPRYFNGLDLLRALSCFSAEQGVIFT